MAVTKYAKMSRRGLLIGAAAAGGGLAVGINVPGFTAALAQKVLGAPGNEVGAWVFIRPNDEVVIRIEAEKRAVAEGGPVAVVAKERIGDTSTGAK